MQTNELLKTLGGLSGVRQAQATAVGQDTTPGAFDELLERARGGEVTTQSQVRIAKGVDIKLTPDQLRRASAAADVAEANGASPMILLDGRAYRLDVGTRTIMGEAQSSQTASMSDVDAVVAAPAGQEELASRPVRINPPASGALNIANTSLRQLLGSEN